MPIKKSTMSTILGVVGIGGSTVAIGWLSATKARDIYDEYTTAKLEILSHEKNVIQLGEGATYEVIKPEDKKALRMLRLKTVGKYAGLYVVPVATETLSVYGMCKTIKGLETDVTELSATLMALDNATRGYRSRVAEEIGAEDEQRIWNGGKKVEVDETVTDENGETKQVTKTQTVYDKNIPSMYARWFVFGEADSAEPDETYNLSFLHQVESTFTFYLRYNKKVFLNDIYRELGIKQSVAGNRVGWVYDPNRPESDNRIDLRVRKVRRRKQYWDGVGDEYEWAIMIDPNVDGPIEERCLELGLLSD